MKWSEVVRMIKKCGAKYKREDKEHTVYWNPKTGGEARIPRHSSKEAPTGTVQAILRQLGLK